MSAATVTDSAVGHNRNAGVGWVWIDGPRDGDGSCSRPVGSVEAHGHCFVPECGACLLGRRWGCRFCSNACRQRAYRTRAGAV